MTMFLDVFLSSRLPAILVLLGPSVGCSRASAQPAGVLDAGADASVPRPAEAAAPPEARLISPAVFSAPIAAVRVHHQLVVAGLVATEGVIRVMGLRDGLPAWTADVLRGVAWIPDAEVKLQPAGDGVVVSWRGSLGGKTGTSLVVLGPQGELRGEPLSIGAASCTTADGLAWIEPRTRGPARVRARGWADPAPHDVVTVAPDRAPTLSCGDHDGFVLGDGDDDLTATGFSPGASAQPPTVAIRDRDFGDDDEREHEV